MIKKISKIFYMLLIIPMICLCFAGCSTKEEKIMLTTENIGDYLVINYCLSNTGDSSQDAIVTIETSKRIENIEFYNCEIQISSKKANDYDSNSYKYNCVIDYNGQSKHSYIVKSIYNSGLPLTIKVLSITTGYVIVKK